MDVATHEEWLAFPERYRPERRLRGHGGAAAVVVLVFICATCSATWRVLPAFLARCLWYPWAVVEQQSVVTPRSSDVTVPARTVQRWRGRPAQAARVPAQVLAVAGGALHGVVRRVGLEATRAELVAAAGVSFAAMAALLHRVAAGVRLM